MADDVLPACTHRPPCPSCPHYGTPLSDKPGTALLVALAAQQGLSLRRMEGAPLAYRHRARLAIRGRSRSPKVGVFQAGSHRIVDIPNCRVHHPAINSAARTVKHWVRRLGLEPYSETAQRGLLRYLQCSVGLDGALQVVVVCNAHDPDAVRGALESLAAELGESLSGLFWNGQPESTNTILGPSLERIAGRPALMESLGGAKVYFPPDAFAQANMPLFARVVEVIHDLVPEGARVLELYAGAGAIGLGLLARGERVTFNEVAPGSLQGLQMGLEALPDVARGRTRVLPGPAGQHADRAAEADVVIVDPPRKGLEPEVLDALATNLPQRVIYLSCGLSSFLRDAEALTGTGPYRITRLQAIDLFPQTEHIETLAVFERR